MIIYTIKPGDSLYTVARQYGVTVAELERFNELSNPNELSVGLDLLIPVSNRVYYVQSGDSLYSIAAENDIPLDTLLKANPKLAPSYTIYPDELLILPSSDRPKRQIEVNGYAYPNINNTVLQKTLPFLTYISIFSHKVFDDGGISTLDDSNIISTAKQAGVAPIMVITNTESGGGFSSRLASTILNDAAIRQTLINNVVDTAIRKGYLGVDVDFEYIFPNDRENYNLLLQEFKEKLYPLGLSLSTAVAPKISATQKGTLYEGHDYAFHGSVADRVIIMTYEWGYLYGPPMAVAPYNEVKRVISYAVTEIPSEKILMGMPNYAYDWTLPYTQGRPAEILSINTAISRAYSKGAEIKYNQRAESPFYEYTENGVQHIVWFENARSTAARLSLIEDYNLGGVSYWTINQFYSQNWQVLQDMYDIKKVLP